MSWEEFHDGATACRVIAPGESFGGGREANCPVARNFLGGNFLGVVFQGELFRCNCLESESAGGNCLGGSFIGGNCPRITIQG